jgi:phosphinothricin acetyltransferase
MTAEIIPLEESHWPRVREIYLEGIASGNATFETDAPSWELWDRTHLEHSRLIFIDGETIQGWAALAPVSARTVYSGVAEVSVYVSEQFRGRGVGRVLLRTLVESAERNGIWTLQAGVFPENAATLALHNSCGFRVVGRRRRIGCHNGIWRDTLLLERRSTVIGIN